MYSVEDLLISHGYKVPQRNSNNVPISHSSSPHPATYEKCLPTRSDSRCEIDEKRKGHSAVNGYEGDHVYSGGGIRQTPARGFPGDTENRVRKQRTQDVDNGNLRDGRLPEDSLTTDSGFYDSHRGIHSQPRSEQDVSYWRRRGQDFSVLLDYADFRDPRGNAGGVPNKPEGMQRRPESALSTEEHNRARQRRAESTRAREREMALHQWRIAAERKYQSLGTEEWRPMTNMSRQPSEIEVVQEQRRPRTAEGAVPPRTKSQKSQSLPRMALQSESLQYFSIPSAGQDSYRSYRLNGHHTRDPHVRHLHDRSGAQSAPPLKPRFSRPLRPPSYEVHQQMRGSAEILTGELAPRARDRTPLPFSRQEYFVQELGGSGAEPPGYIPPPSYRRQPVVKGGHITYPISMGNHQFRGDPYMQGSAMTEVQEWFIRQTGMAWPDHYRDGRRSMPCRRQAYPGYSEERMGNVQYIPFDDPRVRHISATGIDGNSLTDADKIRNIRNEIPVNHITEKNNDSAFPLKEKSFDRTEPSKSNMSDSNNENSMHKEVLKETESSNTTSDQNCNRETVEHGSTVVLQMTSQQNVNSNQGFIETVTQVKKFEAQTVAENKKNSKKRLKETMFCLVSVPINMQANKVVSDTNNNEKVAGLKENTATQPDNQNLSITLVNKDTLIQSSGSMSITSSKNSPLRKEVINVRSFNASQDNELCYAGSWPGDQYRNQETQTASPEILRNTQSQRAPQTSNDYLSPHTTTNNQERANCGASYGYPMIGQKDLNPSTNSAFSRTGSSSSIKSPTLTQSSPTPSSPDRQPLLRKTAMKQTTDGQEVFGQFLLKPVTRRKWDAIGELESFNKEIQDQTGKCPNVDQNIEELDDALNSILELSNASKEVNNRGQETSPINFTEETDQESHVVQVTETHLKRNNLNVMPDSESNSRIERHPEYFSKANVNLDAQTQETPKAKANYVNFEVLQKENSDPGMHRQDIPVQKECLLKDVGLTVYTAIPDTVTSGSPTYLSPESPMLTSPSDNSELCDTLHITSSDSSGDLSRHSPELAEGTQSLNDNNVFNSKALDEKEAGGESAEVARSGRSSHIHAIKSLHCRFKANYEDDDDNFYSDYLSWSNEKTLADEHLETLLSQEKANSMRTEDLSKLYQVQCAKGIPENESIEERAARILGIAVPVESLVDGKQVETTLDELAIPTQTKEISSNKETKNVSRESEEVPDRSMESHEVVTEQTEVELGDDPQSGDDLLNAEKHGHRVASMLELPEFPPSSLCLSLLLTEDEELTLSVCGGDKKVIDEITEAPWDEMQACYSSSTNDQASLECSIYAKEDDCQSSVRTVTRITLTKETEDKQGSEDNAESDREDQTLKETDQFVECTAGENKDSYMHEGDVPQKDEKVTADEKDQDRSTQPLKSLTRPIPQPRSGMVAKREITLPQVFNIDDAVSTIEGDDKLCISDSYDPSRVERV